MPRRRARAPAEPRGRRILTATIGMPATWSRRIPAARPICMADPPEGVPPMSSAVLSPSSRLPAAFGRLAWSNLVAQSAEQIGLAATPLIAVLALGAGAGETGLLQAAQTLPFLLLSLPAGWLADRNSRRLLMAGAELIRAAS